MQKPQPDDLVISGAGITSAIGQGLPAFTSALFGGETAFREMRRPGRQRPQWAEGDLYLGAELESLALPDGISGHKLPSASLSAQAALATVHEAWQNAKLEQVDPQRIGLIVGGSNLQQRELLLTQEKYRDKIAFLRPTYGFAFLDSDIAAVCSEAFGIRGPCFTVGGASASGHVAAIQGIQAIASGAVDACIVVGALTDLSYFECQALRSMGAMGSDRFAGRPKLACRPFDSESDGFIYGEGCGAIVMERHSHAQRPGVQAILAFSGWAMSMDANRGPECSLDGEINVIQKVLQQAGIAPREIDYVNPHGSGSSLGDRTELQALRACGLSHAPINATKSITGHTLSAAGVVELIATLVQMRAGKLHPSRNLENPIDSSFRWIGPVAEEHPVRAALNLSYGFGGINTAICLRVLR
jgi:malonyl-ACP decarboxylase